MGRIYLLGGPCDGEWRDRMNLPPDRHRVATRMPDDQPGQVDYIALTKINGITTMVPEDARVRSGSVHPEARLGSIYPEVQEALDEVDAQCDALNTKPTNPKDAVGCKKMSMAAVPCRALVELGVVMQAGALKYGRHNWRVAGVRSSIYYDAMMRHLMKWWEGETLDEETGMSHLAHGMACAAIIIDSEHIGVLNDDRPPVTEPIDPYIEGQVEQIIADNPNPLAPNTETGSLHHCR